jgi:PAS domain-containing protein
VAHQPTELILARQLASGLAVPVLLIDARGDTVFFNEPAELIFGIAFDEIDSLPLERRTAVIAARAADGTPLPIEDLPGLIALRDRHPAHQLVYMHGFDGVVRAVESTAIPLESAGGHVLGVMLFLWRRPMADGGTAGGPPGEPADGGTVAG